MILNHTNHNLGGQFTLTIHEPKFRWEQANQNQMIHILWNHSDLDVRINLDSTPTILPPQSVLTTTHYHQVEILNNHESLIIFSFNKPYYCIYDHDSEVSCNGIIFFGAQEQAIMPGLEMGKYLPELITNQSIEFYYKELGKTKAELLHALDSLSVADFHKKREGYNERTGHNLAWTIYHLAEDEVHHRGQMSLIRKLYKHLSPHR